MKIKVVLIFILCHYCWVGAAQVNTKSMISSSDALNLAHKYALISSDSASFRKLFFKLFPDNFESFNQLYGYKDSSEIKPLYNNYFKHISFLYAQKSIIPDTIFYMKIIRIGVDAKWDADAINLFQDLLFESIHANPTLTLFVLNQFNKKQIKNFCRYILDGANLSDQMVHKKYLVLLDDFADDKHIAHILHEQFYELKIQH